MMKQVWLLACVLFSLNAGADKTEISNRLTRAGITNFSFQTDWDGRFCLKLDHAKSADLAIIKELDIKALNLTYGKMTDLDPLQGAKLESLDISSCKNLTDITGLEGMPLERLWMVYAPVEDISVLATITQLQKLNANCTKVSDLTPLQNLPLELLLFRMTEVRDVSPLANLPLIRVEFSYGNVTNGIESLRAIETLESICSVSPDDFWDMRSDKVLDDAYFTALDIPKDAPFATDAQKTVAAITELHQAAKWPETGDTITSDEQERETLMENVIKFSEVADYLGLKFDQEILIKEWDSQEGAIQLSSNKLIVDFSLLRRKTHTLDSSAFNVNDYLEVLPRLHISEGYVLDYVYWASGGDGRPFLYARKIDAPQLESEDLREFLVESKTVKQNAYISYLEALRCDGTEEGFLQLALFELLGDQFYLSWHAAYNDAPVIASRAGMLKFLADPKNFMREKKGKATVLPEPTVLKALTLDPTPTVTIGEDTATISLVTFSNWRGFIRKTLVFSKDAPHLNRVRDKEILIEYRCPVMF